MELNNIDIQLQLYEQKLGLHSEILNCMIVQFSGIMRYEATAFLSRHGVSSRTVSAMHQAIQSLIHQGLAFATLDRYCVDNKLSLQLLPDLFLQTQYKSMVRSIQSAERHYYTPPVSQLVRDYIFGGLVEENMFSQAATEKLFTRFHETVRLFTLILANPAYDKAMWCSPVLLYRILDVVHLNNILNFTDFGILEGFLTRQAQSEEFLRNMNTTLMEISFQTGKTGLNLEILAHDPTDHALLLRSQVELFRGDFSIGNLF